MFVLYKLQPVTLSLLNNQTPITTPSSSKVVIQEVPNISNQISEQSELIGKTDSKDQNELPKSEPTAIQKSRRSKANQIIYLCGICERKFRNQDTLRNHLENSHEISITKQSDSNSIPDQISVKSELIDKSDSNDHNEITKPEQNIIQKSRHNKGRQIIYLCSICGKKFKSKYTLRNHFQNIHEISITKQKSNSESKPHNFKCSICDKSYIQKYSLERHFKNNHVSTKVPKPSLAFKCDHCECRFSHRNNFMCHLRSKHSISTDLLKPFKCPICNESYRLRRDILKHIKLGHDIQLSTDSYTFPSLEKFMIWKNKIEIETNCKYVRYGDVNENRYYFRCHRSGNYNTSGKGIRPWAQKTYKINAYCPAHITMLKIKSGEYKAFFQNIHVGHENNLENLFIKSKSRNKKDKFKNRKVKSNCEKAKLNKDSCPISDKNLETEVLHLKIINDEIHQESDDPVSNKDYIDDSLTLTKDSNQELERAISESNSEINGPISNKINLKTEALHPKIINDEIHKESNDSVSNNDYIDDSLTRTNDSNQELERAISEINFVQEQRKALITNYTNLINSISNKQQCDVMAKYFTSLQTIIKVLKCNNLEIH